MMYLVMECHPAYAIVLDQAGRMIKVANMGYEAGQKVDHVIARRTQSVPLRFRLAPLMIAACLCAAILGGGTYGACFMTYGTVELRINPDVMMSVSYTDRVVGLEGLNEDGIRLIDQVSYKGKNSEEMTQLLVERAVEMGYLKDGGTVSVKAQGSHQLRSQPYAGRANARGDKDWGSGGRNHTGNTGQPGTGLNRAPSHAIRASGRRAGCNREQPSGGAE